MKIAKLLDIRDVLVFGGIGLLGYGLYLEWGLWLAFLICGSIIFALGLLWPVFLNYMARGK